MILFEFEMLSSNNNGYKNNHNDSVINNADNSQVSIVIKLLRRLTSLNTKFKLIIYAKCVNNKY